MTHENVNTASIWTWGIGTLTAVCSDGVGWMAAWFTSNPTVMAQAVSVAGQGGFLLGLLGIATLLINRYYDDRKNARENDGRLTRLQSELDESRRKRHVEAEDWNKRLLQMQVDLVEAQSAARRNAAAINKTLPVVKATAEKSGIYLPVVDPVEPIPE